MKETIRTLIVDDESLARDGIRILLEKDQTFSVIGESSNGRDAIMRIHRDRPDLVFLDIQMPEMDGFDVLKHLKLEKFPMIVFITAFGSYAISAFEVHALDYVLKPLEPARFARTLTRVKSYFKDRKLAEFSRRISALVQTFDYARESGGLSRDRLTRFVIKEGERVYFVPASEVDWIEAADYYVRLHCSKKAHLVRDSLNHLEQSLDPRQFIRIHRSTIVSLSAIKELKQHFQGEYIALLKDGTPLKISRGYRDSLQIILDRHR